MFSLHRLVLPNKFNIMRYFIVVTFCFFGFISSAQSDADYIKEIYKNALTDGHSYEWLDYLSNEIGGRLSGSLNEIGRAHV